ncbi:MAG: hypothetical protein QCI38_05510, partial [Candidatus Thermoplasmatota archaeon]|nr:hypothetical protein [Candidatus Thermoplasmatota archaeon]
MTLMVMGSLFPILTLVPEEASAQSGTIFFENVEAPQTPNFWSMDGLWHVANNVKFYSATRAFYYGRPIDNNYDTDSRNTGNLTLKTENAINLRGKTQAYLSFYYYLDVETDQDPTGYEWASVSISMNGGSSWTEVANLSHTYGAWVQDTIDLETFLIQGDYLLLKFYFDSRDAEDNRHMGWFVDDIRIFTGYENVGFVSKTISVLSPIHDFEAPTSGAGRQIQIDYSGDIQFSTPAEYFMRGVELGPRGSEYVVKPDAPVRVRASVHNFAESTSPPLLMGIQVFNRFGQRVHTTTQTTTLFPREKITLDITWTPTMPDIYIVAVFVEQEGNTPNINPFNMAEGWKMRYRVLSVYNTFLNDGMEGLAAGQTESDDWTANDGTTGVINPGGQWRTNTAYFHGTENTGTSWFGGNFGLYGRTVTHSLTSDIIDVSSLYWAYVAEDVPSSQYPPAIRGSSERPRLYFSFYYCYDMKSAFGFGTTYGSLLARTSNDGGTTFGSWGPLWNTSDQPHEFSPEQKLNWAYDYSTDIPTLVDITNYLQSLGGYNPDRRIQFEFRVITSASLPDARGWALDNVQLLGITPRYGLELLNSNSPITVPNGTKSVVPFQYYIKNTGNMGGSGWEVDFVYAAAPMDPYPFSVVQNSADRITLLGGQIRPMAFTVETNASPPEGVWTFRLWANMSSPTGLMVAQDDIDLVLKIGDDSLSLSSDVETLKAGPGDTVTYNVTVINRMLQAKDITVGYSSQIPDGWDVWMEETNFNLGTGQSKTFEVRVTAPEVNVFGGDIFTLALFASNGDDNVALVLTTNISEVYRLELVAEPNTTRARQGEISILHVTARNTGNLLGVVELSTISVTTPQLDVSDVAITPSSYDINAYNSSSFSVSLNVPEGIPNGIYTVVVEGKLADEAIDAITLYFNVSRTYFLDIVPLSTTTKTAEYYNSLYNTTRFPFLLYNNGSVLADVVFDIVSPIKSWVEAIPSIEGVNETQNNGQQRNVTVAPPADAKAGSYEIAVRAIP